MPACRAWRRRPGGTTRGWSAALPRWRSARRRAPRRRVSCSLRPVGPAHRARLERLTRAAGLFREDEVAIAVELLDDSLAGDGDYRFLGAYEGDELVGYVCWGPVPGTAGTYDLYWLVVDPARQCSGVGTRLVEAVGHRLVSGRARPAGVGTTSPPEDAATRRVYRRGRLTQGGPRAGLL